MNEQLDPSDETDKMEEVHRASFENRQKWRLSETALDDRIRRIARKETEALTYVLLLFAAAYGFGKEYGNWLGTLVFFGGGAGFLIYANYEDEKRPEFRRELLDDWAETTVQHERIAAAIAQGKHWAWLGHSSGKPIQWKDNDDINSDFIKKHGYWHSDFIFGAGYWEAVNNKVHEFEGISHKERFKALKDAKKATLQARKVLESEARQTGTELPYFMRIDSDERR